MLLWLMHRLRPVLTPIVAALAVAYILNPLVTRLERRGTRRLTAIIAIYVVGLAALLTGGILLTVTAIDQIEQLSTRIPGYIDAAHDWLNTHYPGSAAQRTATQPLVSTTADDDLVALLKRHGMTAARAATHYLVALVSNAWYWLSFTLLVPLYSFFFLWHFNTIVRQTREHVPAAYRPTVVHVVTLIDAATANFFRGRLVACLIVGTLVALGWLIVGVPYSLPLGAAVGILNLVPFLSVLGLPPALILTFLEATHAGENWLWPVVLTMAVYMVVQGVDSFVLTPYLGSQSTGLHPVTTVIALMIGGQLLGLFGMLLSIPLASTLKSLGSQYALPKIRGLAAARRPYTTAAPLAPQASEAVPSSHGDEPAESA